MRGTYNVVHVTHLFQNIQRQEISGYTIAHDGFLMLYCLNIKMRLGSSHFSMSNFLLFILQLYLQVKTV